MYVFFLMPLLLVLLLLLLMFIQVDDYIMFVCPPFLSIPTNAIFIPEEENVHKVN